MQSKRVLDPERVRKIEGSFSWIDHRFITGGFLRHLCTLEILLYLFLVAVSDRNGLSFYHDDRIASLLRIDLAALSGPLVTPSSHGSALPREKIPKGRRDCSILFRKDQTDAPMKSEEGEEAWTRSFAVKSGIFMKWNG
jgi:hypothetical protein